jgi:uncharacterized protein (TIGR02246 family)
LRAEDFAVLFGLWRDGDAEAAGAYFCVDGVYQEVRGEPVAGRDAIVAVWRRFFERAPAWRMTVEEIFGGGDRFAVVYTWQDRPGCAIVHVRDGKIALWREYKAGL